MLAVVTTNIFASGKEQLAEVAQIRQWERLGRIDYPQLYEWLAEADALLCHSDCKVTRELLGHAPKLRVVSTSSVGYEHIDVAACSERNIPVGNTPGVLVEAVADIAFMLILAAMRHLSQGSTWVRSGDWAARGPLPFGHDLAGKTLGIVGMGAVGWAVAQRARTSGMQIAYTNRSPRADEGGLPARYLPFDRLLREADCISVHAPLTEATRGLFGAQAFRAMKPGAYFVNMSRGAVVDHDALYAALRAGHLAGAALDVTEPEPMAADHPLLALPNVLVTPHIGSATFETREQMALLAVRNAINGLCGRPLEAWVNPEVGLAPR